MYSIIKKNYWQKRRYHSAQHELKRMNIECSYPHCLSVGVMKLMHVLVKKPCVKQSVVNAETYVLNVDTECKLPTECPNSWECFYLKVVPCVEAT